jgi:hypothetical protein
MLPAPVGPPRLDPAAVNVQLARGSLPGRSVRESVEGHQVSPGTAQTPLDLANKPLTNDLEASPEIPELASDAMKEPGLRSS